MASYPADPPPSYSDHEFDDIDTAVFDTDEQTPVQRRYKKKDDKRKSGGRDRSSSASSVVRENSLLQNHVKRKAL